MVDDHKSSSQFVSLASNQDRRWKEEKKKINIDRDSATFSHDPSFSGLDLLTFADEVNRSSFVPEDAFNSLNGHSLKGREE